MIDQGRRTKDCAAGAPDTARRQPSLVLTAAPLSGGRWVSGDLCGGREDAEFRNREWVAAGETPAPRGLGSLIHDPRSTIQGLAMRAGCRPWSRKVGLAIVIGGGVMEAVGILVNRWGRGWEGFWEKARRKVRKR